MSEAKFTKGPWKKEGHAVYGPKHALSKHKNCRVLVCEVIRGSHRADPSLDGGADRFGFDSEADANLIAAAPDMYAALEAMCRNALEIGYCHMAECNECKTMAALRKARGGE